MISIFYRARAAQGALRCLSELMGRSYNPVRGLWGGQAGVRKEQAFPEELVDE